MRRYPSISVNAVCQRSSTTIEHTGPSKLPRLGQSRRVGHGVCIVPIKKMPPSIRDGSSTATSPTLRSVSTSECFSLIVTNLERMKSQSDGDSDPHRSGKMPHDVRSKQLVRFGVISVVAVDQQLHTGVLVFANQIDR